MVVGYIVYGGLNVGLQFVENTSPVEEHNVFISRCPGIIGVTLARPWVRSIAAVSSKGYINCQTNK